MTDGTYTLIVFQHGTTIGVRDPLNEVEALLDDARTENQTVRFDMVDDGRPVVINPDLVLYAYEVDPARATTLPTTWPGGSETSLADPRVLVSQITEAGNVRRLRH